MGTRLHLIGYDLSTDEGLHCVLEIAAQGASPVDGVISRVNDMGLSVGSQLHGELLIRQAAVLGNNGFEDYIIVFKTRRSIIWVTLSFVSGL